MAASPIALDEARGDALFARVRHFLAEHRLSPEPVHYAFAYEVVTDSGGPLACEVAALTDGGFRLSAHDIERLGGTVVAGAPMRTVAAPADPDDVADSAQDTTSDMVSRALSQLDGFSDTVALVHAETNDFGRDLAASAEAIRVVGPAAGLDEITRLTGAMLERVRRAETKLESARRESDELRAALADARGSARTDALTELPNRRAFDEAFTALGPDAAVAVAICDIDHFKRVNDSFGHEVGDRVLKVVARALEDIPGALTARYGGEEFALLFAGDDAAMAAAAIDDARHVLASRRLKVRETGEPIGSVSFSAGVVGGRVAEGRAALMRRADAALYRAKDAGRARTLIAP